MAISIATSIIHHLRSQLICPSKRTLRLSRKGKWEFVYNGMASNRNELIIFFVYLRKMLSKTIGKVFFLLFRHYCIGLRRYIQSADDLFITSAREKNMITFVMKYVPTSYLMPLFMFRAFSSFLKLAQSSATKSVRLSSAKTSENFFQGPAAALCIKTINFFMKIR